MDYSSAKEKCASIQRALVTKRAALAQTESEIAGLGTERAVLMSRYTAAEAQDKTAALAAYKKEAVSELDQQLQRALKHLASLEQQYAEEKEQLTEEKFRKLYEDDALAVHDLEETTDLLENELQKVFGRRVCDSLIRQHQEVNIELPEEELDRVSAEFRHTVEELQAQEGSSSIFSTVVGFLESGLDSVAEMANGNNTISLVFCAVSAALLFLFFKYLAPVYIVIATVTGSYNIYRSNKLRKSLDMLTAVKSNIANINQRLDEKINNALQESLQELAGIFEPRINKVNAKVNSLREAISVTEMRAENEFQYKPGQLADSYNSGKLNIDARETTLQKTRTTLLSEIKSLEADKETAYEQLQQITGGIQDSWLNPSQIGKTMMFEPKFLLDIKESKPVFFVHPQRSSLFIYKDMKDVVDFVRLLCLQLRIKMSPFCQEVCVYDAVNLGMDFNIFENKSTEYVSENLFRIISDDQVFLKYLDECREDIIRRSSLLNKENMNLQQYNAYMIEQEGMTESYIFSFLIDPPQAILENTKLQQILSSASRVGAFFHLFVREDVFYGAPNTAESVLDKVERCFIISDGKVMGRAVECLLDTIKQSKEKR